MLACTGGLSGEILISHISATLPGRSNATRTAARRVLIKRPNIIHITVDTLTAEHLGYMGYDRDTSPTIDKLAENGVHFLHFREFSSFSTSM